MLTIFESVSSHEIVGIGGGENTMTTGVPRPNGAIKYQLGSWCNGITSASHAEGPGFKSQCVHMIVPSKARRLDNRGIPFGEPGFGRCRSEVTELKAGGLPQEHDGNGAPDGGTRCPRCMLCIRAWFGMRRGQLGQALLQTLNGLSGNLV